MNFCRQDLTNSISPSSRTLTEGTLCAKHLVILIPALVSIKSPRPCSREALSRQAKSTSQATQLRKLGCLPI